MGAPSHTLESIRNFIDLSIANRLLVVAGNMIDENGEYQRHPNSNGCAFVGINCIYSPFSTLFGAGTSFSTPTVASALASVKAVYTLTTVRQLVQLAKLCAIPEPGLDGLGRADFTCMTVSDDAGGFALVSDSVGDLITTLTPAQMNSLVLPGDSKVSGAFRLAGGTESVVFATALHGTFGSAYSHHSGLSFDMPSDDGFSPMFADLHNGVSLGAQYSGNGFFIASAYTERSDFFGITDGYDDVTSFDLNVGHRYLYLRASRQEAEGDSNPLS